MTTSTKNEIEVFTPSSQPRAVVLIFGWLGSNLRHVNKYSQLYHARNCATVTGSADSRSILTGDKAKLDAFALEAATKAIKLLKDNDQDLPVIAHVFSNGGTLPLNRLEVLIHKAHRARASGKMTPLDEDLILLGKAWERGGQIFDSSPAYPDVRTAMRAIGSSIPNAFARFLLQAVYLLMVFVDQPLVWLSGYPPKAEHFWDHVMHRPITSRQAYVYSSHDNITNCDKLEELIAHRQEIAGSANVFVKKFTDSHHVQHLRKHPDEYSAFVDEMLLSVESGPPVPALVEEEEEHIIMGGTSFSHI